VVAFAGGIRFPDELASAHMSFGEMFNNDAELFRSHHPETWARRNIDQIRGKLAIQMYVGDKDESALKGNRRMHAVLNDLKIEHGYQEFPGIAHNLKLLAEQVRAKNFEIAVQAFGKARGSSSN
jgi:enterochelin esterase-like enzyme